MSKDDFKLRFSLFIFVCELKSPYCALGAILRENKSEPDRGRESSERERQARILSTF